MIVMDGVAMAALSSGIPEMETAATGMSAYRG